MKITENSVPHCGTAGQGIAEEEALKKGMEAKSKEFLEKGSEVTPQKRSRARSCHCQSI